MNQRIAETIDGFGRRWNDYTVEGAHHVPSRGGALLVFYHGFIPLDAWYFGARHFLDTGRTVHGLADRWLFKVPGLAGFVREMGSAEGTRENALSWLAEGHLVGVSPGGTREAIQGRPTHYRTKWGHRRGFVDVAIEAGVPLIPGFTENVEELYRSPYVWTGPVQAMYERTRWPLVPIVGMGPLPWPVKLTSRVGEPVHPRPGESADALRDRIRDALQSLIDAHTPRRPRLARALLQRLG